MFGDGSYGEFGFGDLLPADAPLEGNNLKGPSAYGAYGYGQIEEPGADITLFVGALQAGNATVDADAAADIALSGDLDSGLAVIDGVVELVPAMVFTGDLQAANATVDADATIFVGAAGDLEAGLSDLSGVGSAIVNMDGAWLTADAALSADVLALLGVSGSLESDNATFDAELLVFKRRRMVHAIAY